MYDSPFIAWAAVPLWVRANMREFVEMMAGRPFSDEEWQMQVEAAREMEEIDLPNGIDRWLEMLPVEDEGKCPETVSVEWNR